MYIYIIVDLFRSQLSMIGTAYDVMTMQDTGQYFMLMHCGEEKLGSQKEKHSPPYCQSSCGAEEVNDVLGFIEVEGINCQLVIPNI